jgi:predicted nucleic acid-binding protein
MTPPARPTALFDTNVLIYAADATAPQHPASLALRDEVEAERLVAAVTPQILLEFVCLVTSKRVAAPRTVEQAWKEIEALSAVFQILSSPADLIDRMNRLVPIVKPKGPEVYDLAIAVTAMAAGLQTVYTYDPRVFARVPGINPVSP